MSMTREEAIKALRLEGGLEIGGNAVRLAEFMQGLSVALTVLRGPTREMVERMRGEWIIGEPDGLGTPIHCSRCGWGSDHADQRKWIEYNGHLFCGHCGAPMTDEAVDMMLERWKEALDGD